MSAKKISTTELELDEFNNSEVARFLTAAIDMSGVSQKEIARRIGYAKPNIITMFKQGLTKLPIDRVAPMAEVLGIDPMRLMDIVMREYQPAAWEAIQSVVGYAITKNEMKIITKLRELTKNEDPKMATPEAEDRLGEFAKTLV